MASVLVAGGTGLVGRRLVGLLLASGNYDRVHVLGRRSTGIHDPGLIEHSVDFGDLSAVGAAIGDVSDAFCTLGTTIRAAGSKAAFRRVDHDFVLSLARFAMERGVPSFLTVSSLGADPGSGNFYLRVKGETERELDALGLGRLVILRPSLLTGDREEFRAGERASQLLLGLVSPLLAGPLGRVRPVSDMQVARAMLRLSMDAGDGTRIVESDEIRRIADSDTRRQDQ